MSQLFSHSWFQLAPTKLELSGSLERHFHPVHTFVLINVRWSSAIHTKPQHLSLLSLGTPFSVCSYLHISDLLSSPLERTGSPKRRKHMNSVSTHWKLLAMWISLCSLSVPGSLSPLFLPQPIPPPCPTLSSSSSPPPSLPSIFLSHTVLLSNFSFFYCHFSLSSSKSFSSTFDSLILCPTPLLPPQFVDNTNVALLNTNTQWKFTESWFFFLTFLVVIVKVAP